MVLPTSGMKAKAVARPLTAAAVALWVAALLSGAGAQPSSGTLPLLQSLVDLESVEVSVGGLAPALPQEALAPAVSGPGGGARAQRRLHWTPCMRNLPLPSRHKGWHSSCRQP